MAADMVLRSRIKRGRQLLEAGRYEEARTVYKKICGKLKGDADSWYTLGVINGLLKHYDDAVRCCARATELAPNHSAAWYNLGVSLRDAGAPEKAVEALRKVLLLHPAHGGAAACLAHVLIGLKRYDEAEDLLESVQHVQSGNIEFFAVYGSAMQVAGRYEAAINAYRKAIDSQGPVSAGLYENMGVALCLQGRHQDAIEAGAAALELEPGNARIHSSLLLTSHYLSGETPESIFERHKGWVGNSLPRQKLPVSLPEVYPERLRIGYVSSDFRAHSVAYYFEPLLENHDANRFEITCYFTGGGHDETTERLQQLSHRWRDVDGIDDESFLKIIADDGIDILVDLNGHTSGGRLTVFARRAAPVQLSCIGYPGTTGVAEMDYRLSDLYADPHGAEQYYTESLYRLPGCFLCYRPPACSPDVASLPCESNGYITFGSFNNLAKINARVVRLWAELMKQTPASRLVIKNPSLADDATRERYRKMFESEGIHSCRIDLVGYIADTHEHLAAYGRIDIGLDTFPYNGTTTTCEALWMGVPVVSLCGDRHAARVGASLLSAAGFPEWLAFTEDQYLDIAGGLAKDAECLAKIRFGLRGRVKESSLCQEVRYTRCVEAAYNDMALEKQQDGEKS